MAEEKHYDDSAFAYFALSVLVIILIPCTLYYFRTWKKAFSSKYTGFCNCNECVKKSKKLQVASRKPSAWGITKFVLYLLLIGLFVYLLRTAAQGSGEVTQFDPFQILEIDSGADEDTIKKNYRRLSLKYHPDKNKDPDAPEKFIAVSKAYDTLTDPETREKWEKYGNPDGPQGLSVGIALPSFLVDKQNKLAILGIYILFLVVIFPIIAICYWQRQKAVAHNQLLNNTMQLFYQATNESMRFKKLIEVFSAAFEYKEKIPVRRSDEEVLMKLKPLIPEAVDSEKKVHKTKKRILLPHILKNVMLFYGHFSRLQSILAPLQDDVDVLVKQFHHLVIGMAELTIQAWDYKTRQPRRWLTPTVEAIQMSQMVTQAVWSEFTRLGRETSMLQIPHLTDKMITKLRSKRVGVYSIASFCTMPNEERRKFLLDEGLKEDQIQDVENICKMLPHDVSMHCKCEVDEDDESVGITGGSIVTLIATFSRPSKRDPKKAQAETNQTGTDDENIKLVKREKSQSEQNKKTDDFRGPAKTKDEDLIEVHAPFFPEKKNELWWLIIADERTNRVLGVTRIASLKDGTEARIPFPAPPKPGLYNYTVYLMSDSYVGFDIKKPFKMQVLKEIPYKEPEYQEEEEENPAENEKDHQEEEQTQEEEESEGSDVDD